MCRQTMNQRKFAKVQMGTALQPLAPANLASVPDCLVYAWRAVRCKSNHLGIAATLNIEHT